jgi:hypothetical protein
MRYKLILLDLYLQSICYLLLKYALIEICFVQCT